MVIRPLLMLHMHTQMSTMDGITPAKNLIKRAMKWGMKSIAITDHGSVQAFPDAHKMLGVNNPDMKVLYGVEAYLVPDKVPSVSNPKGQDLHTTYCVLDLETTGLSFRTEKITEIGIMKMNENGEVIGYKTVHLGKMLEQIRKGADPKEAFEKNVSVKGRFEDAVKVIDPRKE